MTNTMPASEAIALIASRMPEKTLQDKYVIPAFKRNGFDPRLISHAWRSDHSTTGVPDVLAIRGVELHIAELKKDGKHATAAQQLWLDAFARVSVVVVHGVIRPSDIPRLDAMLAMECP